MTAVTSPCQPRSGSVCMTVLDDRLSWQFVTGWARSWWQCYMVKGLKDSGNVDCVHVVPGSWSMTAGMSRPVSLFSQASLGGFWLPTWFYSWTHVLVQYFGLFQAPLVACIVQMFTHRCSRVSVCGAFFVSCPQASARLLNVYLVTAVTFQ